MLTAEVDTMVHILRLGLLSLHLQCQIDLVLYMGLSLGRLQNIGATFMKIQNLRMDIWLMVQVLPMTHMIPLRLRNLVNILQKKIAMRMIPFSFKCFWLAL